jgi:hypothetical protein
MRTFFLTLAASLWLASPLWACPWCRPRVRAGIYTPAYSSNVLLVLLPVALLLALGASVFYWDKLRTFLPKAYEKR